MYYLWDVAIMIAFVSTIGWIFSFVETDERDHSYKKYIEYQHISTTP